MAYIFDAAVLGILLLCIIECTYKGFVRAILETGGGIVAAIGTYFLAKPAGKILAEKIFDGVFEQTVSKALLGAMGENVGKGAFDAIKKADITRLTEVPEKLKTVLEGFGANTDEISRLIEKASGTASERSAEVVEAIAHPISLTISTVIAATVIFALLMTAIALTAKLATGISYLAGVGKINRALGTVFGIAKGAVIILFVSVLIGYMTPYIAEPLNLDYDNPYEDTLVYKYIDENNPLIKILPDKIED